MARLKPKGRRIEVDETDNNLFIEEIDVGVSQLSGRRLVYGLNNNLYQPISVLSTPVEELSPLREQLVRYGLPVGWECELEVPRNQFIQNAPEHEREVEYTKVVARANRHIRNFLRQQSTERNWSQFRYAPMVSHKYDGSLSDGGREFVFSPMTPDFARASNAYGIFTETLSDYQWLGHDGGNTGGHMHIPLGAFSDQQLVLFYKLIETFADSRLNVEGHPNPELAARFIQIIGQRQLGHWAKWYRLESVGTYYGAIVEENRQHLSRTRKFIVEKSRHNTIELRFPKGTFAAERAIMRTSFLHAMYNYTYYVEQRSYSDRTAVLDVFDTDKFVRFVGNTNRWPELKRYLRRHYTGTGCVTDRGRNETVSEDIDAYNSLFVDSHEHAEGRV